MSVPATSSTKDLAQNLYRVLAHVTEGMKPEEVVGEEGNKHTCSEWIATARAAVQAAQKKTPELVQIEQIEMALALRCRVIAKETKAPEIDPLLELLRDNYKTFFPNGIPETFVTNQLLYLCRNYPDFAQRLLTPETSTDEWSANFIKFAIAAPAQSFYRGTDATHWIDIFIKYPEVADRLIKSHLYVKLGLYPENIQLIEKKHRGEVKGVRHVCLKIDLAETKANKWVPINFLLPFSLKNIAEPSEEPLSITMEQVFQEFKKVCPNFDVSKEGVINLNPLLLGSKNKEGILKLINLNTPNNKKEDEEVSPWQKYKPALELSISQLHKKYGTLPEDFEYGFVLKADRLLSSVASIQSHASFDFIIKNDAGDYQVFSMNPYQGRDMHLHEQKMVFYSLTVDQAKAVNERVKKDIEDYRKADKDGKSILFINIEPYMDEIFGGDFYRFLTELTDTLQLPDRENLKKKLAHAKQTFDPEDFVKFVSPILQELVNKRNVPVIQNLIQNSLNTLKFLLQIKEVTSISAPDEETVRLALSPLWDSKDKGKISESLLALTRLCFVLLHPYSVKATDVEKNTPVIGMIVQILEAIPLKFLRDLLRQLLLLALSRFRSNYRYKKPEEDRPQSALGSLIGKIRDLKPLPYLNQPDQIFETYKATSLATTTQDITKHLEILAKARG